LNNLLKIQSRKKGKLVDLTFRYIFLRSFSQGLDTDFHNQVVFFPSVTICPVIPYNENLLNDTAEGDISEDFIPVLQSLPKLTYHTFDKAHEAVLNMTSGVEREKELNLRQLAFKYGIACEDLFELCKYKDEDISCCDYFFPLYTEQGFCYSFNSPYYGAAKEE
jgi:acid-sensing ion channel, other